MTVAAVICGYLAIGGLFAAFHFYVVKAGLEMMDEGDQEVAQTMQEMERATGVMPAGMIGVLLALVVAWPLAAVIFVRSVLAGKRAK